MTTVFGEVTYPVMGVVKWHKTYFAMIATPLGVSEVILAHLGFVVVPGRHHVRGLPRWCMAPFGVFASWLGVARAFVVAAAARAGVRDAGLRLLRGLQDESAFALVFRLGDDPAVPVLRRVLPDLATCRRRWRRSPGSRPCGTASTSTRMLTLGHVDWSMAARARRLPRAVLALAGWSGRSRAPDPEVDRLMAMLTASRRSRRGVPGLRGRGDRAAALPQLPGLPPGLVHLRQRLPRAGLLPVLDRRRRRRSWSPASRSTASTIPYAEFVAPGMLAASAMNGSLLDSTFNFFFKLKYNKLFDQMLATPHDHDGHRARRAQLVAAARRHLLRGVPARDGRDGSGQVVVGGAGGAGGAADRPRVRRRLHGADDVHAQLAGLRVRHAGDAADVPVLGDVLPGLGVPAAVRWVVEVHPALPRRRARAASSARARCRGARRVSVVYLVAMGLVGLLVVRRRLDRLLLT